MRETHLKRFVAMYESLGVTPELVAEPRETNYIRHIRYDQKLVIAVEHDSGQLIDGYYGFHYEIYFDASGKFVGHGVWE